MKVMFITFGDFRDTNNGGAKFSLEFLNTLKSSKFTVHTVSLYDYLFTKNKFLRKILAVYYLFKLKYPIPVGYFYSSSFSKVILQEVEKSLVLGNKLHIIIDHLELCYIASDIYKLYGDKVVISHISHNIEPYIFKQKLKSSVFYWISEYFSKYHEYESMVLQNMKNIFSISASETKYFSQKFNKVNVVTFPPIFHTDSFQLSNTNTNTNTNGSKIKLIFLASMGWYPNREAYFWILNHLLPVLDYKFHVYIYGSGQEALPKLTKQQKKNITLCGFVDDINEAWEGTFFSLAPINSGAGINIKVAESLHNSIPVIGTFLVNDGLEKEYTKGLLALELNAMLWNKTLMNFSEKEVDYIGLKESINYLKPKDLEKVLLRTLDVKEK